MASNSVINIREIYAEDEKDESWDDFDLLADVPVNTVEAIYIKKGSHRTL